MKSNTVVEALERLKSLENILYSLTPEQLNQADTHGLRIIKERLDMVSTFSAVMLDLCP